MKSLNEYLNEAFVPIIPSSPVGGAIIILMGIYFGIKKIIRKINVEKENIAAQKLMDEIVEKQLNLVEILKKYPDIVNNINKKYKSIVKKHLDILRVRKAITDTEYYNNYRKSLAEDVSSMSDKDSAKFIEIFDNIFELQKELYNAYGHLHKVRILWLNGDVLTN